MSFVYEVQRRLVGSVDLLAHWVSQVDSHATSGDEVHRVVKRHTALSVAVDESHGAHELVLLQG